MRTIHIPQVVSPERRTAVAVVTVVTVETIMFGPNCEAAD